MSDEFQAVLAEEYEVLESIFPDELERISDLELTIRVEPEEPVGDSLILSLRITYTASYPDALPEMDITPLEGELAQQEDEMLREGLVEVGEESLGMPLVFTLASWLKEKLSVVVMSRQERKEAEENRRKEAEVEDEVARTRGTPVTRESFLAWREKFLAERAAGLKAQEDEALAKLAPKERDEMAKRGGRKSGKQLFERDRSLATSDATLMGSDDKAVDWTLYERMRAAEQDEEDGEQEGIKWTDGDESD